MLLLWICILVSILIFQKTKQGFANKSFLLANKERPSCKSSYSSSGGFICLTPKQEQILLQRGGNRTNDADI